MPAFCVINSFGMLLSARANSFLTFTFHSNYVIADQYGKYEMELGRILYLCYYNISKIKVL